MLLVLHTHTYKITKLKWNNLFFAFGNQGSGKVESISLNLSATTEINASPAAFEGMYNLRLLKFYHPYQYPYYRGEEMVRIHLPQGLHILSNELRILSWCHYPLKSLPSNFFPKKLVVLKMPDSQLEQLWNDYQVYMLYHTSSSNILVFSKIQVLILN